MHELGHIKGSFIIRSHREGEIKMLPNGKVDIASMKAAMKNPLYESLHENKIVTGTGGTGRNLLLRQMSGDTTFPILIDSGSIGTGTNAPADSDTGLQTSVLAGIDVALFELTNNILVVSFFIPTGDLANGTYKEFAAFMGAKLFSRALITPNYVKGTGIDTTFEYTYTFTST